MRRRTILIGIGALAVVAVAASGAGFYLRFLHSAATRPAVAAIGAKTVSKRAAAEVLTVVKTTPPAGSQGTAVNSPVDIEFNLPVDPTAVQTYFSVLPNTAGSFSQGGTADDVTFTPSSNFTSGSSVSVVLRRGLTSRDGAILQGDYSMNFITAVSAQSVMFQANGQVAMLVSAQSGRSIGVSVQLGDQVPGDLVLKTYKATAADLLKSFLHSVNGQYTSDPVDTSAMQVIDSKPGIKSGDSLSIAEPDGIYLLLAQDAAGQYGTLWLDFSKYGVLLRQDDLGVVVAGQDLTSGETNVPFTITFYRLQDAVQTVASGSFSGSGQFPLPYPQIADLAIASAGGEDVVIPISAPATNADIKVVGDLRAQQQIFLTTDRAGYQRGETVRFAGVARTGNDQEYSVPAGGTVAVWSGNAPNRLVDQQVAVGSNGTFSGSFVIPNGAFNQDGTDAELTLYADVGGHSSDFSPFFTVIQALASHQPAARLGISLDKSSYTAGDSIIASISATDASGHPVTHQPLSLAVYSTEHPVVPHEMDSFPSPSSWGVPVQQNVSLQLDGNGHATYSVKANVAQKPADQEVTVVATYGSGASSAIAARSAVVYQATDEVFLLASRSIYQPGSQVVAPFVVENRSGERVAGMPMAYEFDKTDYQGSNAITTVIASGSVTTDSNGMGAVRTTYSGPTGDLTLRVRGKDPAGNAFQDVRSLNVVSDPTQLYAAGASDALLTLSITTDKIAYSVGDVAHLTVTAPAAETVFMSEDRGRIHGVRWITLAQGDNPLDLTITPDLAPGFTVTFSGFRTGAYVTEGLPIAVNNAVRLLKISVSPDQAHYTVGQTAHLTLAVVDAAGRPVSAMLIVDAYDANMSAFKLVDQPSLAGSFLTPARRGTNASSSLLGIGNWGGRCGGGTNPEQSAATNPGQTDAWMPAVTTDAEGHATIAVPVGQAAVRVALMAAATSSTWGQAETDLTTP
jgi:uncharacterized Zn-binding protein involved in type VI secretion